MKKFPGYRRAYTIRAFFFVFFLISLQESATAQSQLPLNNLSAFKDPGKSWQIARNVTADLQQTNLLKTEKGEGVLVNIPGKKEHGADLFTTQEFSDVDLELEYMMAKGSNSGIYLQGRYEVQLMDSWANGRSTSGDNGGIYERWDDARGTGNEGYDGHAPRQNVSRAPGLWQQLKIVFQAPRFDGAGKKTENARLIKVELNGVLIHENVELLGPTRGAVSANEVPSAPLRFQGDHGAVAFRNITVKNYSEARPILSDINYSIYKGQFAKLPRFDTMQVVAKGETPIISTVVNKIENDFLIRFTGKINVKSAGNYLFKLHTSGGTGSVKINDKVVKDFDKRSSDPIQLQPGTYPLEVNYAKFVNWERSSLGLSISSENIREFLVTDPASIVEEAVDPILIQSGSNTILRSFMDIPEGKRITHAVSVGSDKQLHYTYDLDHGIPVQAWRGGFLDATPMWHDRGDGSSRPLGSKIVFGTPYFSIQQLKDAQSAWNTDSAGTGFVVKGYETDEKNNPTFRYNIYGAAVLDALHADADGEALNRTVTIQNNPGNLFLKLAEGKLIENLGKGLFAIDDKRYYIRMHDPKVNATVRTSGGKTEMIVPVQDNFSYSILF